MLNSYLALRAVLHTLRDRLIVDEAIDLGAQLPMLVRGFYYENWQSVGKPLKYRHKEEFLNQVKEKSKAWIWMAPNWSRRWARSLKACLPMLPAAR
jgi:uncharacterized protein (DUF2267 family)